MEFVSDNSSWEVCGGGGGSNKPYKFHNHKPSALGCFITSSFKIKMEIS